MNFNSPRKIPFFAALLSVAVIAFYLQEILHYAAHKVDVSTFLTSEDDDRSYVQKNALHAKEVRVGTNKQIIYVGGSSMREATDPTFVKDGILHLSATSLGQDIAETVLILNNLEVDSETTVVLGLTPVSLTYPLMRSRDIFNIRVYPFFEYSETRKFLHEGGLPNAMDTEMQSIFSSFGKYLHLKVDEEIRDCLARIRPSCVGVFFEKPFFHNPEYLYHRFHLQLKRAGIDKTVAKSKKRIEARKGLVADRNLQMLSQLADMIEEKGARVVFIFLPVEPGLRPDTIEKLQPKYDSTLKVLAERDHVDYFDMTYDDSFGPDDFRDAVHVNESGYKKLNPRLHEIVLKSFEK